MVVAAATAAILGVVGSRIRAAQQDLVSAASILDAVAHGVAVPHLLVALVTLA